MIVGSPGDPSERLQAIGRELCKRRGVDPDERVPYPHPDGCAVNLRAPRWALAAEEVRKFEELQAAIAAIDGK